MSFIEYIKDKLFTMFVSIVSLLIIILILLFLDAHILLIVFIPFILIMSFILCIINDYKKRYKFYDYLKKKLDEIDKKYLITEVITKSDFYEGNIILDYLHDIDKCYYEELNVFKYLLDDFKNYIELWCHEIKIPIATSKLILENKKNNQDDLYEEIHRVETFVEQVLFYARSENVEKDYIIKKTNLLDVVNNVIKKNKKYLINKKINIISFKEDCIVESDSKWLEYIINQIIVNSIKYSKNKDAFINISFIYDNNSVSLIIKDNGIGIKKEEIIKVFDKGFTGSNGRKEYNSTGMGLFLCRSLCNKLHHDIIINSEENNYTEIRIVFPKSVTTNVLE